MIIEPRDSLQRYGKCIGGAIKADGTSAIDKAILRRPRKSWVNSALGVGKCHIYGKWHMAFGTYTYSACAYFTAWRSLIGNRRMARESIEGMWKSLGNMQINAAAIIPLVPVPVPVPVCVQ